MSGNTVISLKKKNNNNNNYTPTYSDELLDLITDLYKTQIKPHEKDWVLLRLLDLIQVTEEHFEAYREHLANEQHLKCLEYYIVGVFLIYLIIPKSIQFQIKNKNYELFLTLKSLYDKETGMSNVNLQVIKFIGYIQEKEAKKLEYVQQNATNDIQIPSTKARSYTLPALKPSQDLNLTSSTAQKQPRSSDLAANSITSSEASTLSQVSTNSSIPEDLWSPPELQPNDQLKLAEDNDLVDEFIDMTLTRDGSPDYSKSFDDAYKSNYPRLHHANSFPVNYLVNGCLDDNYDSDGFNSSFTLKEGVKTDYFNTKSSHRNDSYHSIYASDEDESIPTVSSKWLFENLSAATFSFLIFDIRPKERFSINHIAYPNVINIDPSLVLSSGNFQELDDVLRTTLSNKDYLKFKNIRKYEQVVSYTDLQSSASESTDYISKFSHALNERYIKNKHLSGGFDSWTKFLSKNYKISKSEIKFVVKDPFMSAPPLDLPSPFPETQDQTGFINQSLNLPDQRSPSPNTVPYDYSKLLPQISMNLTAAVASVVRPPIPVTTSMLPGSRASTPDGSNRPVETNQMVTPVIPQQSAPPLPTHTIPYQRPIGPVPKYAQPMNYPNQQFSSKQTFVQRPYVFPSNPNYMNQQQVLHRDMEYPDNGYRNNQHNYQQLQPQYIPNQSQPRPAREHPLQRQRINSASIPTIQASDKPFVRLSITGLRNMSNTCYINSMIQCLFASTLFRDIFLENKYEDYSNPKFSKTRLSPALSLLFKKMFLNGGCSIVPSGFLKTCMALRPDFKIPSHQQDTHEFLMFLLDQLHDELSNSNTVVNDFPDLIQHDDLGKEYDTWFEGLLKQGFSPLSHIFQGQLQDSLQCMKCGFKSSNYSSFYMLSLVIPKTSVDGKKLKKITLEDCIQLFTHDEILSGENAWTCPKCNKTKEEVSPEQIKEPSQVRKHRFGFGANIFRSARSRSSSPVPRSSSSKKSKLKSSKPHLLTDDMASSSSSKKKSTVKSLNFVVLPPVLVIHLSRFLFYDTSQKDNSVVQYPLILQIPFKNTIVKYKLFGVINHYGTLKSGHYTAITNKNLTHDLKQPNWYYFDDEVVKATNHGYISNGGHSADNGEQHMSSSDVYVLFYERIN